VNAAKLAEARIPRGYWHMTRQAWRDKDECGRPTPWPTELSSWVKGEGGPVVTLYGDAGTGKSHMAVATLIYYLGGVGPWGRLKWWSDAVPGQAEARNGACFFTGRELAAEYLVNKFRPRVLLERALAAPLVVVDDVLWDRSTDDLQRGAVAALIHSAEQTKAGLILTMNADDQFFLTIDGRIMTRLAAGIMRKIQGEDRR
jgi:hypothetical protein